MRIVADFYSRSSYLITCVFVCITAAVLAEVCSALPAAGSIYLYVTVFRLLKDCTHYLLAGLLKLGVENTVDFSDSLSRGGVPQPGQPSLPQTVKLPPIFCYLKSGSLIFPFQLTQQMSSFELFNGLFLKSCYSLVSPQTFSDQKHSNGFSGLELQLSSWTSF